MPITSRRARTRRDGRGETAGPARATKRPKRPAAERRSLMRSRVLRSCRPLRARPTVRAGPTRRSTRLSTKSARRAASRRPRVVDQLWTACGRTPRPAVSRPSRTSRSCGSVDGRRGAQLGVAVAAARPDRLDERRRARRRTPPTAGPPAGRARRPRTGRCRACPRPRSGRACSRGRTAAVTDEMTPNSPRAVEVAPAIGDLAAIARHRPARPARRRRSSRRARPPARPRRAASRSSGRRPCIR